MKALLILTFLLMMSPLKASPSQQKSWDPLLTKISQEMGVPKPILKAVCRLESDLRPYVLNVQGEPHVFESAEEARFFLRKVLASGIRNVDVGCMQINWRWHEHFVKNPELLLDGEMCLRYGAFLLKKLAHVKGGWTQAVLHYHSGDTTAQERYLTKFKKILKAENPGCLS